MCLCLDRVEAMDGLNGRDSTELIGRHHPTNVSLALCGGSVLRETTLGITDILSQGGFCSRRTAKD